MALYYEAAEFLTPTSLASSDSLSSRVYAARGLKSQPAHIYALLAQTAKWSAILSAVIEHANLLDQERKLTPALALLLSHDLLLSKRGVAASQGHILSQTIARHRVRLSAELAKARVKAGFPSLQAWADSIESQLQDGPGDDFKRPSKHPRWVRVNTLRSSLENQLSHGVFRGWDCVSSLSGLTPRSNRYFLDPHIPNLVAAPSGSDFTKTKEYLDGHIILQDKASCFSAYLLDPRDDDGDFVDGCAAPGNKTTHLAMLLKSHASRVPAPTIWAVEKDRTRSATLQKMVQVAGAARVKCLTSTDFKRLSLDDARLAEVGGILLDPSCSGSGIVGRDQGEDASNPGFVLPERKIGPEASKVQSKKRKRGSGDSTTNDGGNKIKEAETSDGDAQESMQQRLEGLSSFQLSLLKHAFAFPKASKVVYSTCSVHAEENELVALRALQSDIAHERGWRLLKRSEQVEGLQKWHVRGDKTALGRALAEIEGDELPQAEEFAEACIRCQKATEDGTMGFFVVGFVREANRASIAEDEGEEEWAGFSDGAD